MSDTRSLVVAAVAAAAIGIISKYSCLHGEFTYDDHSVVESHPVILRTVPLSHVWSLDYWGNAIDRPWSHASFRPLTTLSFWLSAVWSGATAGEIPSPYIFRLPSFVIHAVNCMLLVFIASRVFKLGPFYSFVAGAVFAAHPVTSEAVCSISCRADLLAQLLTLISIAVRPWNEGKEKGDEGKGRWKQWAALACCVAAILCKETAVMALVLHAIWAFAATKQRKQPLLCVAIIVVVAVGRLYIQGWRVPQFSAMENSVVKLPALPKAMTLSYIFSKYICTMLWPHALTHDWSFYSIPPVMVVSDVRNAWSLVTIVALGIVLALVRPKGNAKHTTQHTPLTVSTAVVSPVRKVVATTELRVSPNTPAREPSVPKTAARTRARSKTPRRVPSTRTKAAVAEAVVPLVAVATPQTQRQAAELARTEAPIMPLMTPPPLIGKTEARADEKIGVAHTWLAVVMMILPVALVVNPAIAVGFTFAERIVYASMAGFAIFVGTGLQRFANANIFIRTFVIVIIAMCISGSYERSTQWTSERSLWQAELEINPTNSKALYSIGLELELLGNSEEAIGYHYQAIYSALQHSLYSHLNEADTLYLDPSVRLVNILIAQGNGSDALAVIDDISNRVQFLYEPSTSTAAEQLPTVSADAVWGQGFLPTYAACALSGTKIQLAPAHRRVPNDMIVLTAMLSNGAVLSRQLGRASNVTFDLLLKASATASAVPPELMPATLALSLAELFKTESQFGLSARWFDVAKRTALSQLSGVGHPDALPFGRSKWCHSTREGRCITNTVQWTYIDAPLDSTIAACNNLAVEKALNICSKGASNGCTSAFQLAASLSTELQATGIELDEITYDSIMAALNTACEAFTDPSALDNGAQGLFDFAVDLHCMVRPASGSHSFSAQVKEACGQSANKNSPCVVSLNAAINSAHLSINSLRQLAQQSDIGAYCSCKAHNVTENEELSHVCASSLLLAADALEQVPLTSAEAQLITLGPQHDCSKEFMHGIMLGSDHDAALLLTRPSLIAFRTAVQRLDDAASLYAMLASAGLDAGLKRQAAMIRVDWKSLAEVCHCAA